MVNPVIAFKTDKEGLIILIIGFLFSLLIFRAMIFASLFAFLRTDFEKFSAKDWLVCAIFAFAGVLHAFVGH
jgi:hypothetical protein